LENKFIRSQLFFSIWCLFLCIGFFLGAKDLTSTNARGILSILYVLFIMFWVLFSKDPKGNSSGSQYIVAPFSALSAFSFALFDLKYVGASNSIVYGCVLLISIICLSVAIYYEYMIGEDFLENYFTIKMPIMVLNFVLIFSLLTWSQPLLGIVEIFFKTYLNIY
jgi:hypothetical protein